MVFKAVGRKLGPQMFQPQGLGSLFVLKAPFCGRFLCLLPPTQPCEVQGWEAVVTTASGIT